MARDKERKRKREEEEPEETSAEDIGKELQELESAWSEAEVQEGFGDLPDDTYQMKVTKAYLNKSKSSGRLQLTVEFTVATGKFKNRKKWSHYGIVDAQSLGFVKTLFARLKLDPPKKLAELNDEETLEKLLDITCECSVKTRGDFQNVYVNKPIDLDEEGAEDADDWEPSNRSKKSKDADEDEDEEDEKPKKKRDRDEDEDEDEPSKKADKARREIDEDEDDDKPKKKSRRDEEEEDEDDDKEKDEEEDEDEKPKKKSKSEDEDDEDEDKPRKKKRDVEEDEDDERPAKKKSKF